MDVGINREVTLSLAFSPKTNVPRIMLTRFYTAEEILTRRKVAEAAGKSQTYVNPFANMAIPIKGAEIMISKRSDLQLMVARINSGDYVDEEESMVKLSHNEKDKLYLKFDGDSGTVHIRKYWQCSFTSEWKPHKQGVAINSDEFTQVLMRLDEMLAVAKAHMPK